VFAEGRWHADEDGVTLGQAVEVGRGLNATTFDSRCQAFRSNVFNVRNALVEGGGLLRVDVKTDYRKSGSLEDEHQR
jgi:hypothetical protein